MRPARHFEPALFSFLRELRANNERAWFLDNKNRYERHVLEPALEFVAAMEAPLRRIAPHYVAIAKRQGGSVMRVYRDVRFAHNKAPYKTNLGIHFRHAQARDVHAPGYYLHLAPDEAFFGVGCWRPDRGALAQIRTRIETRPKEWLRARDDARFRRIYELSGASLKRTPRGIAPEHPCVEDLRRTDYLGVHAFDEAEASESDFLERACTAFTAANPLMRFLCRALDLPF